MISTLAFLAALGAAQAADTPVGHGNNFGIGADVGTANPKFTGKYWFDDQGGLAFFVGAPLWGYLDGRVQYERQFVQFGDWDFADLGMYWDAGVATILWDTGMLAGPSGGVGAEMRFKDVPAAVYVENDVQLYFYNQTGYNSFGYIGSLGGRWYF